MGNSRAELLVYVGILVAVVVAGTILNTTSNDVAGITQTIVVRNITLTAPTNNGSLQLDSIYGRELIDTIRITNSTNNGAVLLGANLSTRIGSDGLYHIFLGLNATNGSSSTPSYAGQLVNVSFTAYPTGYVGGASNNLILTVILFGAIAILLYVVIMVLKRSPAMARVMQMKS